MRSYMIFTDKNAADQSAGSVFMIAVYSRSDQIA